MSITRQAKIALQEIEAQKSVKNKELQIISEKVDTKKSELKSIESSCEQKKAESLKIEKENKELKNENDSLKNQIETRRSTIAELNIIIGDKKHIVENQQEAIHDNDVKITTGIDKVKEYEKLSKECDSRKEIILKNIEVLSERNKNVVAELNKAKQELKEVEEQKVEVLGLIEEAMSKFRVFENRIHQFSKDTGYIVGYKRPDTKLKKQKDVIPK